MNPAQRPIQALGVRIAQLAGVTLLLLLVTLPLLALLFHQSPLQLVARLGQPAVLAALRLSAVTSLVSTIVVVALGLPVAYLLATRDFPGRRIVEAVLQLPIVLPPTVAGVGLLLAFGRAGLAGGALNALGITLPFSVLAVVIAQLFVSVPFFVASASAGFASVDPRYLEVASTLRAPPAFQFFRVLLPLALPSVLAGAGMAWARALGEFGATITFAGNLPGRTQTLPLAVYTALQQDLDAAVAMSVILVVLSFTILIGLRLLPWPPVSRIGPPGARR